MSPRDLAKQHIMKLGLRYVASWCNVGEAAVYKWFERATDERPIPLDYVPAIVAGARRDGKTVSIKVLAPSWPEEAND